MNKNIKIALTAHFLECIQSTDMLRKSVAMQQDQVSYTRFSQFIYKEAEKNNIKNILEIELSILNNDLNKATDNREIGALNSGIDRIKLVLASLGNISHYKDFKNHLTATSFKDIDASGLPKDAFRKEIPAQITSLQNNTRDNKSQYLKDFIDARCAALRQALSEYKDLQHKFMQKFCQELPQHPHAIVFLAKSSNQKRVKAESFTA